LMGQIAVLTLSKKVKLKSEIQGKHKDIFLR
jgi:hypothetical protein